MSGAVTVDFSWKYSTHDCKSLFYLTACSVSNDDFVFSFASYNSSETFFTESLVERVSRFFCSRQCVPSCLNLLLFYKNLLYRFLLNYHLWRQYKGVQRLSTFRLLFFVKHVMGLGYHQGHSLKHADTVKVLACGGKFS